MTRFEKGPFEMLRALASGDPEQVREAAEFQRESFRAQFGCYPDQMREVCPACPTDLSDEQAAQCPIWLSMREQLDADETMATRDRLEAGHSVADSPCVTCGAPTGCNIFFCYGGQ